MSSNTTVARHRGGSRTTRRERVKTKLASSNLFPSLLEAWLALRGSSLRSAAEAAELSDQTLYNILERPDAARPATLAAIAATMSALSGERITADGVAVLASRRVVNPARASDEIAEALAASAQKAG